MFMQSALARNTLLTLSYRHRLEELEQDYPRVLALLSHSSIGLEEGFRSLANLKREKVRLRVWMDDQLEDFYSVQDVINACGVDDLIRTEDPGNSLGTCLLIPALSYSLVSKLIQFDDRHPFCRVIMEALLTGGKVAAIPIGADPYHPIWREKGYDRARPYLKHEMKSRLQQLRGFGIELLEEQQVVDWVMKESRTSRKKKVISQEDIQKAYDAKQTILKMERGTLITPLAREMARDYGIQLTRG